MWKLLSGIALVVLLDVAFIWMVAVEPDSPEIASVIGPTAAVPIIHEPELSEPVAIDDRVEPVVENSFKVRYLRGARAKKHDYVSLGRVAQPDLEPVAATAPVKLFQDRIIWIGRTEVPVKIENQEAAPVIAEPKPDESMSASIAATRCLALMVAMSARSPETVSL